MRKFLLAALLALSFPAFAADASFELKVKGPVGEVPGKIILLYDGRVPLEEGTTSVLTPALRTHGEKLLFTPKSISGRNVVADFDWTLENGEGEVFHEEQTVSFELGSQFHLTADGGFSAEIRIR